MYKDEDGKKKGMLSVSYDRMSVVLYGMVKRQQKTITDIQSQIDELIAKVNILST